MQKTGERVSSSLVEYPALWVGCFRCVHNLELEEKVLGDRRRTMVGFSPTEDSNRLFELVEIGSGG